MRGWPPASSRHFKLNDYISTLAFPFTLVFVHIHILVLWPKRFQNEGCRSRCSWVCRPDRRGETDTHSSKHIFMTATKRTENPRVHGLPTTKLHPCNAIRKSSGSNLKESERRPNHQQFFPKPLCVWASFSTPLSKTKTHTGQIKKRVANRRRY